MDLRLRLHLADSRVARRITWLFLLAALAPSMLLGVLAWNAWSDHRMQLQRDRLRSEAKFEGLRLLDRLLLARSVLLRAADEGPRLAASTRVRLASHGMPRALLVEADAGSGPSMPDAPPGDRVAEGWRELASGRPAPGRTHVQVRAGAEAGTGPAEVLLVATASDGARSAVAALDPGWLWSGLFDADDGVTGCVEQLDGPRLHCVTPALRLPDDEGGGADDAARANVTAAWDLFLRHEFGAPDWRIRLQRSLGGGEREAEAAFGDILWRVGALTLLLVALLSLVLVRRTLQPLRLLTQATKRLAAGEPSVAVEVAGRDELAQLGTAFNEMARRLEGQRRDLERRATHDLLTGLLNRTGMQARMERALAPDEASPSALLLIDLDHFSEINDTLGHEAGDALLQQVAARLVESLPAGAVVARHGGDEFLVRLDGDEAEAVAAAERLCATLARPFVVQQREIRAGGSIGIACFPRDGDRLELLLRRADLAMYQAKGAGRNRHAVFRPAMDEQAVARRAMLGDLLGAAARGELLLHYQPRVDGHSGRTRSVEALVRWQHPARGLVPPGRFIPLAEETGLIREIGAWVLDEACRQMSAWRRRGLPIERMSVNVSVRQLREDDLAAQVEAALARHRLPAGALELEVTESVMAQDAEGVAALLQRLRRLGVTLALDDFGTGYSSMSYLRQLPFDVLKIDRSFVRDLVHDASAENVTRSIVGLGKGLAMTLVAEGVEDAAQARLLAQWGVEEMQGFLFARPMPAADLEAWLGAPPAPPAPVPPAPAASGDARDRHPA